MTSHSADTQTLQQLLYLSFRAAWADIFELVLRDSEGYPDPASDRNITERAGTSAEVATPAQAGNAFKGTASELKLASRVGFLDHIPLLAGTASHVQLDCLLRTWSAVRTGGIFELDIPGQCVCYCSTNLLARLGEIEHRVKIDRAAQGPAPIANVDLLWLTSKLRSALLTFPIRFPFLRDLSDQDLLASPLDDPDASGRRTEDRLALLTMVGTWRVSSDMLRNSVGLLDASEMAELSGWLQKNSHLMNP